jgi:hypothetical protein
LNWIRDEVKEIKNLSLIFVANRSDSESQFGLKKKKKKNIHVSPDL